MPIIPPRLDDRSFPDLVEELLSRIPAHTPEWRHARVGDPGRTMLELFAWLADAILYRANLIPERQRLAFLRLLGTGLRPAGAATGVVSVQFDSQSLQPSVTLRPLASIKKPVPFETRTELTVVHLTAEAYRKRPLTADEKKVRSAMLPRLAQLYGLKASAGHGFYETTPVFPGGLSDPRGIDLVADTVDHALWVALLAPKSTDVAAMRADLTTGAGSGPRAISVGVAPAVEIPALFDDVGVKGQLTQVWEITGTPVNNVPTYHRLSVIYDSTSGLTRRGVLRLLLPVDLGAPTNDVKVDPHAGLGDRPPRLDDPDRAGRLVAWLRLRPAGRPVRFVLSWLDLNAVEIDQRLTVTSRLVGQSDGTADQLMKLPAAQVEPSTFQLMVEEPEVGFRPWAQIEDLALARRDDAVYELDPEAGTVRFGDGIRGRIPAVGSQVMVARMRSGGGLAGNVPPLTINSITAATVTGGLPPKLKVVQALPTLGGDEPETLAQAEQRIPALMRHGDRAVTEEDYRRLAASTPGVQLGRVEVLPRFEPKQRRDDVPGVVSVMVLPAATRPAAPYPRPDRPLLEAVHGYLDPRRPLTTELYVMGCEYIPLGLGVGVTLREGSNRELVMEGVRQALQRFLFPTPPGGPTGTGWPLGRDVMDRELLVAVAQVDGVSTVAGISLFTRGTATRVLSGSKKFGTSHDLARFTVVPPKPPPPPPPGAAPHAPPPWISLKGSSATIPVELALESWQLPELLAVAVDTDGNVPTSPLGAGAGGDADSSLGVAVPVVPEVC
ncbi:MAG TPA: putative baseplate assembly protein [Myxococcales bacterium]|nr:putative baseplate assembly protein [Myxococcales bacterium]